MTTNECMVLISEWYKKASTYKRGNAFQSAYLSAIAELSSIVLITVSASDSTFIYIDKRLLSLKLKEIYADDDERTVGSKTANNDLYEITNKWRTQYYKGKMY